MAPPSNPPENDVKTVNGDVLMDWEPPKAQGLYDPQNEHEACGVGFIVAIDGKRNHKVKENFSENLIFSLPLMQQTKLKITNRRDEQTRQFVICMNNSFIL